MKNYTQRTVYHCFYSALCVCVLFFICVPFALNVFMFYACWTHVNCLQLRLLFLLFFFSFFVSNSPINSLLVFLPLSHFHNSTHNAYLFFSTFFPFSFFFLLPKRPIRKSLVSIFDFADVKQKLREKKYEEREK